VVKLDHVVYAVADLDRAADRFRAEFGLESVPGGRHVGWGTGNRIVPLGDHYIELISPVSPDEAASSSFGRRVLEAITTGDAPFAICASTDDLDGVAARLDAEITTGARARSDGIVLQWRSVALEDPRREPWMPFFITWDVPPKLHPGQMPARHRADAARISMIEVAGDRARLDAWLGGDGLPFSFVDGSPGIVSFRVSTSEAEISLR
jgi:catechol 2,3-dioxygenase-like lactoylglutathione lyase family enzyme